MKKMIERQSKLRWMAWAASIAVFSILSSAAAQEELDKTGGPTATPKDTPVAVRTEFEPPKITPGPNMTLAEAILAADRRNLTLAAARLEIEKTEAQLSMAWSAILPGAEGKMQYMHRDHEDSFSLSDIMPGEMVMMPQEDLKGTFDVGMPLVNAQSWYTISAAKKGIEVARMTVEQARQRILLGVAQAYYMALMAHSLIDSYITQVESAAHHFKVADARFKAGTGLRIDVIRAETDLEEARQELLRAHLALDNSRDAIGILTGTKGLPMPVETQPIKMPKGDDKKLVDHARRSRPDIKVKKLTVDLMKTQLDASWMQFLPTLSTGWQLQYQFTKPGDMGSDDRSRWAAMLTLSVPIYNHYRYGDLDHKRASLRQSILQLEDAEQNASMEIRKARRDYLTALLSVNIAERQINLAKEALALTEASYVAGTGSSLDVTDARRRSSQAQVNLVAKRLQAQVALLSFLSAIGEDMHELSK